MNIEPKQLALRIAAGAREKKAQRVIILDMRHVESFCDYFVIASATSNRHSLAIAQGIEEDLDKEKLKPASRIATEDQSGWLVLDYNSVVAHVFYKPLRDYYALERLWQDAKRVRITRPAVKK